MPAAFDELAPEWSMGLVVLGALVAASLLVAALRRLRPASDFSELALRVRSWFHRPLLSSTR